ncbi:MAG: tetratricopeptide repeat protein [Bacteroidales bacterium]|nr:tetratricopeptide repeat protein [Bacteroidales bacterium]
MKHREYSYCLRLFIIIGLVQLGIMASKAQSKIDSLEYVLAKVYTDTAYASLPSILDMLAEEYRFRNPAKSLDYANELRDESQINNDLNYSIRAYTHIGNTYSDLGIYYLAYENYYKALEISKEFEEKVKIATIINAIGNINYLQGLNDLALDHFNQALAVFTDSEETKLNNAQLEAIAGTYSNIAWVFSNNNELDTAKYLLNKALDIRKSIGDVDKIGYSFMELGHIEMSQNKDEAITLLEQAISLFEIVNDNYNIGKCHKFIGDVWYFKENYENALDNYQRALEIFLNEGNRFEVVNLLTLISRLYLGQGRLDEAKSMANRVLELSIKSNFLIQQRDNYKLLSEIYTQKKDYKTALDNFKNYASLLDSIYSKQVIQTLTRIEVLNETEIREREIAIQKLLLSRKNFMLITLISIVFLMGMFVYFLVRRHELIKKTSKVIQEQQHKIYAQQKLIMEQNEENLKKELAFKNQEVTYKTMNLLQSNEYYLKLVETLKVANKENNNPDIEDIIRSLNAKIKTESSEKTWQEFEILFMQLHQDFFARLNKEYPDLTTNEKRLCSFLRLNMTTKDISTITGQTIRSIEIARTRLRKKLNLKQEENLVSFILSL